MYEREFMKKIGQKSISALCEDIDIFQNAEALYEILETFFDGILISDGAGNVQYIND